MAINTEPADTKRMTILTISFVLIIAVLVTALFYLGIQAVHETTSL